MSAIPLCLRERAQWVCWRAEQRGARATKVPYHPASGTHANTTDPRTWTTYEAAQAALQDPSQNTLNTQNSNCVYSMYSVTDHGLRYSGVGFVFCARDPYCGVDLDGALRADGVLYDWAAELLSALDSYAEISPSGTGIHVIVAGRLAGGGRRCGAVEVYDRARYFTMTGERLSGLPAAPMPRQAALDELVSHLGPAPTAGVVPAAAWAPSGRSSDALRVNAHHRRIRADTLALLDSTGGAGYASPSEADAALCAGLAGAGFSAGEIHELLAGSRRGLDGYRRKGERHGAYYWRRTIEHAVLHVGPVVCEEGRRYQEVGR